MLTTVIIDDDEISICLLVALLNKLTSFDIKIVGTANNLEEGVKLIKSTQPDIVFLDIEMPWRNGLEIYTEFKSPLFKIIFCTAHQKYAIDALHKSAFGYILKPVDLILLREALQKVSVEILLEQKQSELEDKINTLCAPDMTGENIMLDVENGFIMENTRNIEYCYANQSYAVVVTYTNKEILVTKSLKELEGILPENQFYRTHKSFLVNIFYIRKFAHSKESYVLLKSGKKIPVSVRIASVITKDIKKKLLA